MRISRLLAEKGIIHGYATRTLKKHAFLSRLGLTNSALFVGEQVHGNRIATVADGMTGRLVKGVDGLVSKGPAIGVTFADCTPILAVDPEAKVLGVAHAGWRGTLSGIATKLIAHMVGEGASKIKIIVSIGPRIGMCCYRVDEDRARIFMREFSSNEKIVSKLGQYWHVDIGYANYLELRAAGIRENAIDRPVMCTSCQVAEFHSFRGDIRKDFDVQLGVIRL